MNYVLQFYSRVFEMLAQSCVFLKGLPIYLQLFQFEFSSIFDDSILSFYCFKIQMIVIQVERDHLRPLLHSDLTLYLRVLPNYFR